MRLKLVSTATTKPTITLHSAKATKNTTMAMMGVSSGAITWFTTCSASSGALPVSTPPADWMMLC